MDIFSKINAYMPVGTQVEIKAGNKKFLVRGTKQERSFIQFGDTTSAASKLCKLASENDVVRMLLFLKGSFSPGVNIEYPFTVQIPMLLTYREDFLKNIKEKAFEKYLEEITEKRNKVRKEAGDAGLGTISKFLGVLIKDRDFQDRLRKKRLPKKAAVDDYISKVFSRHENEVDQVVSHTIEIQNEYGEVMKRFEPVLQSIDEMERAEINRGMLGNVVSLPNDVSMVSNALSKIEALRGMRFTVFSVCLECLLERGIDPNMTLQIYPGKPEIPVDCNKCSGKTVMSFVGFELPPSLIPLFHEHRIQEFAVAFHLARNPKVKEVFVHKKIHPITPEGEGTGREVDVLAILEDGTTVAIEVTTTTDMAEVIKKANQKEKLLADLHFDLLVYATASTDLKHYSSYGKFMITGAKHLNVLDSHIFYTLKSIKK